jgi:D-alanine-D-alanine ligase-like ATP-grasp enzyme
MTIYNKPLGTPLSPAATRVMLLGSGELGKEVLIALQRLGVETIAVDRYENAPGQQVAHHAHTITMSDPVALRALIEREKPDLVVPEIEALATHELQALEDEGVVRVIPTARAARLTMDREGIRRLAAETLALPTSPYVFCDSLAELQAAIDGTGGKPAIGYPCIVKPVMSSSGKGQSKIDGPGDVSNAWDYAMAGGRVSHGRVIVEGFIDFDYEITLLTVRSLGANGAVQTSFCAPIGHVQVKGDYVESWQPMRMDPAALATHRQGRHRRPGRPGPVRRRAVRQGLGRVVQRGQPAPARHRHGDDDHAVAERVRAARPRHPRPAGGRVAEEPGRQRGDLRRRRCQGTAVRRPGRRDARAADRGAPVRQARELRQAPHGRGAGARRRRGARPRAREGSREQSHAQGSRLILDVT